MKALICLLNLLLLTQVVGQDKSLESYKKKYNDAVAKMQAKLQDGKLIECVATYQQLEKLELKYKNAGSLEELLVVRNLLKETKNKELKLLTSKSKLAPLTTAITKLKENVELLDKSYKKSLAYLNNSYINALSKKIKELTKEDEIDEAVKFNKELANFKKSGVVLAGPKTSDKSPKIEVLRVLKKKDFDESKWKLRSNTKDWIITLHSNGQVRTSWGGLGKGDIAKIGWKFADHSTIKFWGGVAKVHKNGSELHFEDPKNQSVWDRIDIPLLNDKKIEANLGYSLKWAPTGAVKGPNGHKYLVIPRDLSFEAAIKTAKGMGGYLATISSKEENNFIYSLTRKGVNVRLGGALKNGKWVWLTGEPWIYTNWSKIGKVPQPSGNGEDSLMMYGVEHLKKFGNKEAAGLWNDIKKSDTKDCVIVLEWPK